MRRPIPTPVFRIVHVENLALCLQDRGMRAASRAVAAPGEWRSIHDTDVQRKRGLREIPVGSCGTVHDYVPFYLGPRAPMLLRLHTGRVEGYDGRQDSIVYVTSTVEAVDWETVYARTWNDTPEDPDRQRRKQAEFLIHGFVPWSVIDGVAACSEAIAARVRRILDLAEPQDQKPVLVRKDWYY